MDDKMRQDHWSTVALQANRLSRLATSLATLTYSIDGRKEAQREILSSLRVIERRIQALQEG